MKQTISVYLRSIRDHGIILHYRSLRRFLEASVGLIVIVALFLLAFGIEVFVYRAEESSWRDRQNEAAISAATTIDLFLRVVHNYMGVFSQLDAEYLRGHPETMKQVMQQTPALLEMIRLDKNGEILVSSFQDAPLIANLFTFPQSNWFIQAKSGKSYLGDVELSADNKPYLLMAIPAPDGGVVAARLRMDVLWEVVSDIHFGQTGQAYIVNANGDIIAHPNTALVLDRMNIQSELEFSQMQSAPNKRWHAQYSNFQDLQVVGSSAPIPNTDWIIVNEVARWEAFTSSKNALMILGAAVILVGLLMYLLNVHLLQVTIFTPLENLRSGANRIGQGDLSYRIQVSHEDEIGDLTEAFNEMTQRLSEHEEDLKSARDEALQASQFKSRLLANVGHDLRTPINSILGYSDILNEGVYGGLNEQQKKANARILSNARRLIFLINSLLDQAQIEVGKLVLRTDVYNPRDLLTAVRDTFEIPAQSKGLALNLEFSPDLPETLIGDQQRTQQMVLNLVENAIKFTSQGCITVRLYLPDSASWAIEITDTGIGIPDEAKEFIFDPFRQIDGSTTRGQKGIGLGLSIVKQLTQIMQGDITLTSKPNTGSTFTLVLPLIRRISNG